ncbi:MAG: hypothetical protein R2716_06955 [Microthrixaceae bacterium]
MYLLAAASAVLVLVSNLSGIAIGDDGVGYRAIADSIAAGNGLGYFLDDPLTIWPPLWPALMALIDLISPLDTLGAAVLLNIATAATATIVGHGLLRRVVRDRRLVGWGTAVIALGSSTVGFGHLLMTDLAFAVVVMVWLRCLIRFRDSHATAWLVAASLTVWVGFGLRYVALYLLALGFGWLLFEPTPALATRLRNAVLYGAVGIVAPALWMIRNHAIDGTFTGERNPSARGPIENAFDVLATMGQWLLPGIAPDALELWAAAALVVLVVSAWLGYRILRSRNAEAGPRALLSSFVAWIGSPSGLLAIAAFGYLAYMVYVRSSTALNRLELRLLNPAYFSLIALALVLVANLDRLDRDGTWLRRGRVVVALWAVANIAAGFYAAVLFATGDPFFEGNYNSEVFEEVRANPALDSLPADCDTYSNLPNALYPALESEWSPRRTALESTAPTDDLEELRVELGDRRACLVWIDEEPNYGHLYSREELEESLLLRELDSSGPVTVYEFGRPES